MAIESDNRLKSGPGTAQTGGPPAILTGTKGPLVGLVLLCVALTLSTDTFLTFRNILNVLDQVTVLGVLAIGMTLVILIGGIDLSVGSVLALSGMVLGYVAHPDYLGLPVAGGRSSQRCSSSAACGLVSGLLVTIAKLPAFIATLAMMSVARGLANIITDGSQIVGFPGLVHQPVDHAPFRLPVGHRGRDAHPLTAVACERS